jgi:hypothetical protein
MLEVMEWPESVPDPDDHFDVLVSVDGQFFPQPADVRIRPASGNIRRIAPNLLQDNRSGHNLSGVLNQERQQPILNRMQRDRLTVQHHYLVAQMHKQVFITIELLVQGWQKHYAPQGVSMKPKPR